MPGEKRYHRIVRMLCTALALVLSALNCETRADAEIRESDQPPVASRLELLEQQLQTIIEDNERLSSEVELLRERSGHQPHSGSPPEAGWSMESAGGGQLESAKQAGYTVDYDDGFLIAPEDPEGMPFSLKFNNQTMFRYTGFARGVRTWTDSAGIVRDVTNRSAFEIPRGRAIFSGNALLPNLTYWLSIDYNTVTDTPIGFRGYALSYRFDRSLTIHVGQNKVPGSREWLSGDFYTVGPDRSLATTFFRPSLSQGIWFTGEPLDDLHYYAMVANGFNTLNVPADGLDTRFCWSGSLWWEPWGKYGETYSDLEWHDESVIRCGTSLTYTGGPLQQGNSNAPENVQIRLSDGTLISETGAFAPGVTLQSGNIALSAFDFGWKKRGWSVSGEFYLQDLFGLRGNGPLPISSTFAFGGFAQVGFFPIREQLEIYARTSQVSGAYGTGGEYAGGFNWYITPGRSNLRFTLDGAWLNHSPAEQSRTDYQAGDTGLLLRSQLQMFF